VLPRRRRLRALADEGAIVLGELARLLLVEARRRPRLPGVLAVAGGVERRRRITGVGREGDEPVACDDAVGEAVRDDVKLRPAFVDVCRCAASADELQPGVSQVLLRRRWPLPLCRGRPWLHLWGELWCGATVQYAVRRRGNV
jgi:hypothetical protein